MNETRSFGAPGTVMEEQLTYFNQSENRVLWLYVGLLACRHKPGWHLLPAGVSDSHDNIELLSIR